MRFPVYDSARPDMDSQALASPIGYADTAEEALAMIRESLARAAEDPPVPVDVELDARWGREGWFPIFGG